MNPGEIVICVNGYFNDQQRDLIPNRPETNREYTVREYVEHIGLNRSNKAIRLVEIVNPMINHHMGLGMIEPSFNIERFRKKEDLYIDKEEIEEQNLELIED